jgi:chromosome segregation ATPase
VEALAPEEEKLEELSDALERLRQRDIELSEALQELSEAQEALATSQAEMERLEMDLQELGAQMESSPALAALSDALKSKDAEEAAKLLRELADRLADAQTSEELQELLESLRDANVQNEELAQMLENLQAPDDLTTEDLAQIAEALETIAEQMDGIGQQIATQPDMEQVGQEMEQLEASLGQQQAGQQQTGEQQQAPGDAQRQAGMMSTQMQMAEMQGDPSSAVPVDAGPAGDTTGPGGPGEDPVLGEATTLDVQLEMEVLSIEEQEQPVPEEIFERLSREEKSTLNYEDVRAPAAYAEESAMERDRVPWQYRNLVKRYFLSILTQSSESTSEP